MSGGFNQSQFNQQPFNVSYDGIIYFNGTLSGNGELGAKTNATMTLSSQMSTEGSLTGLVVRVILTGGTHKAESSITAKVMLVRQYTVSLSSESNVFAYARRFQVELIKYMGDLKPGEIIILDSKEKSVKANNENVSHLIDSDKFVMIVPGANKIEFIDGESGRNVAAQIVYREKYLY